MAAKTSRTPGVRAFVCVGLLLLAACSPSIEAVIAEHRPAVEKVFAQLRALDVAVAGVPAPAPDRFELGDARVVLDGVEGVDSNALFLFARDLADPLNASEDGHGGTHVNIATCAEALRGDFYGSPKGAAYFLADCGRAEYAFVLRTNAEVAAAVQGSDSFTPGMYDGDVLLFRLADGALLGGFNVRAESSDEVQVLVDSSGNPIDPSERLNGDLESRVFAEIQQKLRALVPGAIPAS